jgi:hypothetical protein
MKFSITIILYYTLINIAGANEAFLSFEDNDDYRLDEELDYDKLDFNDGNYTFKNQKWWVKHRHTLTSHHSIRVELSLQDCLQECMNSEWCQAVSYGREGDQESRRCYLYKFKMNDTNIDNFYEHRSVFSKI